ASCLAGLAALWCLGSGETASAVAVGLSALLMLASGAMHPPAGIDAFLFAGRGLPASWAISPVLVGAVLLAAFGRLWSLGGRSIERRLGRSPLAEPAWRTDPIVEERDGRRLSRREADR